MKVVLSTLGRFHSFDLARELWFHDSLTAIFTAYPRFKLRNERLPDKFVRTFPWFHAPYMVPCVRNLLNQEAIRTWEYIDKMAFDCYTSRRIPECDVFVGLSGSALRTGTIARRRGISFVCDRGSSHIRVQDSLLREEHERWGQDFGGIDPRVIELEEAEYAEADCITVPSTFNIRSFTDSGIALAKLRRVPYGVSLERFHPVGAPDAARFDILFVGAMSLRKGVQYLLQAYNRVHHPAKSLTLAGAINPDFVALMKAHSIWPADVRVLGHVPQQQLKELMSRSHILVLPSIEEGLAMVQAQALACGCPVMGTDHSGAEDLFDDGKEGFIVRARCADEIAEKLQLIADDPVLRWSMSEAALLRVRKAGGWTDYGTKAIEIYQSMIA